MKNVWDRVVVFLMRTSLLYYISCCLLLLGAYLMMHSSLLSDDFLIRYYETYGIYWLYEIVLVMLCVQVIRKLAIVEDGLVLGMLGILILLDPTFFNNVFYTYKLSVGVAVNTCCFALAVVSIFTLVRYAGMPSTKRMQVALLLTLLFVYFYPVLFNSGKSDSFLANYLYLLWWMPYILLLIVERSDLFVTAAKGGLATTDKQRLVLFRAQVLLMLYITISHLIESNIGYSLAYYGVYMSPLILVILMLSIKMNPTALEPAGSSAAVWVMTTIALLVACAQDVPFIHHLTRNICITPFRLQLIINALTLYAVYRMKPTRNFLVGVVAYLFAFASGYDFGSVFEHIFYLRLMPFAIIQLACMATGYVIWTSNLARRQAIVTILALVLVGTAFGKAQIGVHHVWTLYFWVIGLGVFILGLRLKLKVLTIVMVLAILAWLSKKTIPFIKPLLDRIPVVLGSGIVIVIAAFIALFAGYSLSVMKRKEKQR